MKTCVCPCRILWAFKLNPFEKLNLRFDATPEEVRKQYRKLSLMVHPDKCKHPQAAVAFDCEWDAAQPTTDAEVLRQYLVRIPAEVCVAVLLAHCSVR
jgi:DnaJ family protein C protein 8